MRAFVVPITYESVATSRLREVATRPVPEGMAQGVVLPLYKPIFKRIHVL